MKTKSIILMLVALALFSGFLQAQTPFDKVVERYKGKKGFNTVILSRDMLQLFAAMANEQDSSTRAFKQAVSRMTGMKIVDCMVDTAGYALSRAFFKEATAAFPPAVYQELISGDDGNITARFLMKKDSRGQITELVLLQESKEELVAFSITGIIDLPTVMKISESMNIEGMKTLKESSKVRKK